MCVSSIASLAVAETPKPLAVSGPIAVSSTSQILGAEDVSGGPPSLGLAARGYREEEYFLSGTANIYQYDDAWTRQLKQPDVKFTTRIILRYPSNVKAFNGNLQIECEHPQAAAGALSWSAIKEYVVRTGSAYASIMCGADLITRKTPADMQPTGAPFVMKWFDKTRYQAINWPQDDGIRYDVMAETVALLRSNAENNPLKDYHVKRVYFSGWSFTGSLQRTYINAGFHAQYRLPGGGPLIDGYLIGISASSVVAGIDPLNNDDKTPPRNNPHRITNAIDVPVIELMSENEGVTNDGIQAPDSDDPASRHRLYEVPGLSHGDGLGTRAALLYQLASHGYKIDKPVPCSLEQSDVPMGALAVAALANIDRWVRFNVPPPRASRMHVDFAKAAGIKDSVGNTEGGVRTSEMDVPLARYAEASPSDGPGCQPNPVYHFLAIKRIPLSKNEVVALYGTRANYLRKFGDNVRQMTAAGWLLQPEAEDEISKAEKRSEQSFAQ
jgi:hypothetical protein